MASQRRNLYIKQSQAFDLLKQQNVAVQESNQPGDFFLSISVNRKTYSPCIIASPTTDSSIAQCQSFPFDYTKRTFSSNDAEVQSVGKYLGLSGSAQGSLATLVQKLVDIFMTKEAFVLESNVSLASDGSMEVCRARFGFDDAAYRSSKRQEDIHVLRKKAEEIPEEVEAEKDGIVYIKYVNPNLTGIVEANAHSADSREKAASAP